jgi:tRNA(fMet)-specific endonuclease VapC
MTNYMLDTNACIGIINGNPTILRKRLMQCQPEQISISQIVQYELEFGVCNSQQKQKNKENLNQFLKYVQVLDWETGQSIEAAKIRCELTKTGQLIGHYDTLIAAHARSLNFCIVTHNVHEFERVNDLLIEDWEHSK